MPATAQQAVDIANAGGLCHTSMITVRCVAGEKYDRIIDYEVGEKPEGVSVQESLGYADDDIPF